MTSSTRAHRAKRGPSPTALATDAHRAKRRPSPTALATDAHRAKRGLSPAALASRSGSPPTVPHRRPRRATERIKRSPRASMPVASVITPPRPPWGGAPPPAGVGPSMAPPGRPLRETAPAVTGPASPRSPRKSTPRPGMMILGDAPCLRPPPARRPSEPHDAERHGACTASGGQPEYGGQALRCPPEARPVPFCGLAMAAGQVGGRHHHHPHPPCRSRASPLKSGPCRADRGPSGPKVPGAPLPLSPPCPRGRPVVLQNCA
jgi:hypothetical protein